MSAAAEPNRPRLQPLTRARLGSLGAAGQAWADALPGVIVELEAAWSIRVGRGLPGGSSSYVARATLSDGAPAVLKVAVDDPGWSRQLATLECAAGAGYVRVLRHDVARQALLLEALGPAIGTERRAPSDQLVRLADTLAVAWAAAGPISSVRSISSAGPDPTPEADKATALAAFVTDAWPRLGRPCPAAVIEQALQYAERRAHPAPSELVVVHGDPHPGNLLQVLAPRVGAATGYVFVDPDGFVADRAYDLGVAMRDFASRLLGPDARRVAEGFAELLARRSGADAQVIWEWAFLERVSTGLYVLGLGAPAVARPFLTSAERLLA